MGLWGISFIASLNLPVNHFTIIVQVVDLEHFLDTSQPCMPLKRFPDCLNSLDPYAMIILSLGVRGSMISSLTMQSSTSVNKLKKIWATNCVAWDNNLAK